MNLVDALLGTPEQKTYEFGGKKIVFRTLKQSEMNSIMMSIGRADVTMLELEKIPVLARCIISIDGIPLEMFEEVREAIKENEKIDIPTAIEKILAKMDTNTVGILYGIYIQFREECYLKKEQLKNSSANPSAGTSTASVKI